MKPVIATFLVPASLLLSGAAFAQCGDITIGQATAPNATRGTPYSLAFTQSGASGSVVWTTPGALPAGLSLGSGGTLGGRPTVGGTFALRVLATDSAGCVAGQFLPLTINPTSAPVITNAATLLYTDGSPATVIDAAVAVTDTDSANLLSATVQITGNLQDPGDLLAFTPVGAIAGVYTPATGTLSFSGSDTVANYQTVLRSVTYRNTAQSPAPVARTLTWSASDGVNTSFPMTSSVIRAGFVDVQRVVVVRPSQTDQLQIVVRDGEGNAVPAAPYNLVVQNPNVAAVSPTGAITAAALAAPYDFTRVDITSPPRAPAAPYVVVRPVTDFAVGGTTSGASISATDGPSPVGSNNGLPTTSYYSDVYKLNLPAGPVTITADTGDNLDTYMLLFDARGNIVAINDDDSTGTLGVGSRIDFTVPVPGIYYVDMSTFNGLATGNYTFHVQ